ncbi:hypothetical protein F4677DRAFT_194779 [Hypoxylon crocopeplum]|nr:hypothetical protein F4677DRAFT_194779 [Hypoxylon crocopeplum]
MPPKRVAPSTSATGKSARPRKRQKESPMSSTEEQETESPSEEDDSTGRKKGKASGVANGLDMSLPPISNVDAAFKHMTGQSKTLITGGGIQLRVATMCSGTEAPIFALEMLQDFWNRIQPEKEFLEFEHIFSVEIVPFKQAYILRNTSNSILFNNMRDFVNPKDRKVPTAMGAMQTIPGDIDLLIAGCSCVDFSTLNSNKQSVYYKVGTETQKALNALATKGYDKKVDFDRVSGWFEEALKALNEMGTSGETFFSMLSYVRDERPKAVMLENVNTAPWDVTEKVWFPFLGYAAARVKLDTKDFFIPHTRNRVYLIALDIQAFKPENAKKIVDNWASILKPDFSRRASAPVNSWLLPPAHPLTERARQDDSEKALNASSESDWDRSRARHLRVRELEKLGFDHPVTQWGLTRGQPYDRMDRLVISMQPMRVLDCIEIFYLRGIKAGFDMKFKNRIHDLSQNIDRGGLQQPFGIATCITPGGIHWITDQNRLVSGYEALLLQGLPVHRLQFATETQDQLRNLAGNAMSTTVVGAAFVALLISINGTRSGLSHFFSGLTAKKKGIRQIAKSELNVVPGFSTTAVRPFDMSSMILLHQRCRRYCFCNGSAKYSTDDFLQCNVCSTIRCKWCAGNPQHRFEQTKRPAKFLLLHQVDRKLMKFFPGTITDLITWEVSNTGRNEAILARHTSLTQQLRSTVFYYQSTRVTEVVTVCYAGQKDFELRAVLSENGITWYLYLDPWGDLGQQCQIDTNLTPIALAQPIAKATITADACEITPTPDSWEMWSFTPVKVTVKVTSSNDNMKIKASRDRSLHANDAVPHHINESLATISQTYRYESYCDAPENTLHVIDLDGKRLFLFKDATRTGLPSQDCYIVSEECRFLEPHEYRETLLRFEGGVDIRKLGERHSGVEVKAKVDGYWVKFQLTKSANQDLTCSEKVTFGAVERAYVLPSAELLVAGEPIQQVLAEAQMMKHKDCDHYTIINKYEALTRRFDQWVTVEKPENHLFYDLISYFNIKLAAEKAVKGHFEIEDIDAWTKSLYASKVSHDDFDDNSSDFEPSYGELPQIQWIKVGSKYIAHHHSRDMEAFETHAKDQIPIFETRVKAVLEHVGEEEMYLLMVKYLINPVALARKAAAYLPPSGDPTTKVTAKVLAENYAIISQNSQIKPKAQEQDEHSFVPFRMSLKEVLDSNDTLREEDISHMRSFRTQLSERQSRSLVWMTKRERDRYQFEEIETEEYLVPDLKLRLIGRAGRLNYNRGGVLAHDVGYGKTVVTLALSHCLEDFDKNESVEQRNSDDPDCIHLKATLVVVPHHLVNQWAEQALKFLPIERDEVVEIKDIADLKDDKSWSVIDRLQGARFIIVSNTVFAKSDYHKNLAKLAGSLDPPLEATGNVSESRAFGDWYEGAAAATRTHVSRLLPLYRRGPRAAKGPKRQEQAIEKRRELLRIKYEAFERDYHLRNRTSSGQSTSAACHGKWTVFTHPLEAFTYARVVYDEFSYEDFHTTLFMINLKAYSKWVLSATPPTRNLSAVCGIAKLLQVHVARPAYCRQGMPRITEGPQLLEQTNAEILQSCKFMSDKGILERHAKGQNFLEHFARSDPLDLKLAGGVSVEEIVVVNEMNRYEFILYLDLQQDLRACGMDANMLPKESRALLLPLYGHKAWGSNGHYVAMEALIARASRTSNCPSENANMEEEAVSSLSGERGALLENYLASLGVIAEKAVWLSLRNMTNAEEATYSNATSAVTDICTMLRDVWKKDLDKCGGFDAWSFMAKVLIPNYSEAKRLAFVRHHSEFFEQDTKLEPRQHKQCLINLLKELVTSRSTSWNAYYDLQEKDLHGMTEQEAAELVDDFVRVNGPIDKALVGDTNSETLEALVADEKKGLEKYKAADKKVQLKPNRTFEGMDYYGGKYTKARYHEMFRSVALLFNAKEGIPVLAKRWADHKAGILPDSDYVGFGNCRMVKPERYPTLGETFKIRGGIYTFTRSDVSDTSLELRKALDQVVYAIKQERIVARVTSSETNLRCNGCGDMKPKEELRLVCECGHLLCADHLDWGHCGDYGPDGPTHCPSHLENATVPLLAVNTIQRTLGANPADERAAPHRSISSKSQMIANTIKTIVPRDDNVILFVQSNNQIAELERTLKANMIGFTKDPTEEKDFRSVRKLTKRAVRLEKLKTECVKRGLSDDGTVGELKRRLIDWLEEDELEQPKVRILKLNDATSAGTNLQHANHVMFAAPLLVELQEEYDAFMKQARGRCIRYGQQKAVKVYHFVTANTIEVDILELRKQSHVLVPPGQALGILKEATPEQDREKLACPYTSTETPSSVNTRTKDVIMTDASYISTPGTDLTKSRSPAVSSGTTTSTNSPDVKTADTTLDIVMIEASDPSMRTVSKAPNPERVRSILHSREIWKAMNEQSWLTTVGIEY